MKDFQDKAVLLLGAIALVCLLLAALNQWLLFGLVTWFAILVTKAVGYGRAVKTKWILGTFTVCLTLYLGFTIGIAWLHDPEELRLLGGLPVGTALFVYGIWPLGTVFSLLYAFVFRRRVLPEDRLQHFLKTYVRKGDS